MKRSEMIKLIADAINGTELGGHAVYGAVLRAIEKHMVPKYGGSHQSSYDLAMGNSPEWEEE